jgi:hypothetical protein
MDTEERFDKAIILAEFVKHLPDSLLQSALRMTWLLGDDYNVPGILRSFAERWHHMCKDDRSEEFQLLSQTLSAYRGCPREHLLAIIQSLLPVMHSQGGERVILDAAAAVQQTAEWWP